MTNAAVFCFLWAVARSSRRAVNEGNVESIEAGCRKSRILLRAIVQEKGLRLPFIFLASSISSARRCRPSAFAPKHVHAICALRGGDFDRDLVEAGAVLFNPKHPKWKIFSLNGEPHLG